MADPTLDDIIAAVAAEDTVINSAITFIVSVPALIAAAAASAGIDPTKAAALVADVGNQTTALVAALAQGTPSAGTTTPPPAGVPVPVPTPDPSTTAGAAAAVAAIKKKLGIH